MSSKRKNPHLGKDIGTFVREQIEREPEFGAAIEAAAERREIAKNLRALRERQHLTQGEIARRAGSSQSVIARLETGDVEPRFDLLRRVAEALGMRVEIRFVPAR
ncbi:MAG: helix-turn-helix transcriptional regulator [Deltaproteobacteria bacterium]|nr:helix-turn-helix transcriptional regulator [Deltaproteobacteria bacterium]